MSVGKLARLVDTSSGVSAGELARRWLPLHYSTAPKFPYESVLQVADNECHFVWEKAQTRMEAYGAVP